MKWFNNLKISNKLIISFCIVSVFTVVVGMQGLSNMNEINNMLNSLYLNETLGISYIKEANIDLIYFGRAQNNYLLASSAEERQKYRARLEEYEGLLLSNIEKATPLIHTDLGKKYLADLRAKWTEYKEVVRKVVELGNSEALDMKRASVTMAQTVGREKSDEIDSLLSRLARIKEGNGRKAYDDSDVIYADSKRLMIILIIGALGVGISFGIFIARAISRPVKQGVRFAEEIASGDLTTALTVDQEDEIGQLANALNSMAGKLREVVQDVKTAADNVATGSQELSSSSEQMSQGATEQAAAAEEASSSMEQMSSNISQNADNAQQTAKIALKSAEDARQGGKAVLETVEAMKEIAGKISIIEEIARQTNLLALNAAIEAARAGEHGKGFAVVASEVRKLAERSQTAAGEISTLSKSSVEVAVKAGEMLRLMVPDIQKTADLVQEITAASNEQNSGAEQINSAIQQLNQVIQQNASASEEMASTSEELSGQAEQLIDTIAFFKIKSNGHGTAVNHYSTKKGNLPQAVKVKKQITAGFQSHAKNAVVLDLGKNGDHGDFESF